MDRPSASPRTRVGRSHRLRIDLAKPRRNPGAPAALARHDRRRIGSDPFVRVGFPEHDGGRSAKSVQLAAVSSWRSAGRYRLSRCITDSKVSGISNTARVLVAAALTRKRAELAG